jgi:hypothetical protein
MFHYCFFLKDASNLTLLPVSAPWESAAAL